MNDFIFRSWSGKEVAFSNGKLSGSGAEDVEVFLDMNENVGLPPVGPFYRSNINDPAAVLVAAINALGNGEVISGVMPVIDSEVPPDAVA